MGTKLYVGNLSWGMTEDDLRQAFEKVRAVASAVIIMDRMSGRSKGFGFVEMTTPEDAEAAIRMWNDVELSGRKVLVKEARPREEGTGGGFGSR